MIDDEEQRGVKRRKQAPPAPEEIPRGSATLPHTCPSRDIWRSKDDWPFPPAGYLYVPDVFERIGKARFGEAWTGEEATFRGNVPKFEKSSFVYDGDTDFIAHAGNYAAGLPSAADLLGMDHIRLREPLTVEQWRKAYDRWMKLDVDGLGILRRREEVLATIHREAEAGSLRFYFRHDGKMIPIDRATWNCDPPVAYARIDLGLLNDVPLKFLTLLYGNNTIPFFAREDQITTFISDGAPVQPTTAGSDAVARTKGGKPDGRPIALRIFRERLTRRATLRVQKSEAGAIALEWTGEVKRPTDRRIGEYLTGRHSRLRFDGDRVEPESADEVIKLLDQELG